MAIADPLSPVLPGQVPRAAEEGKGKGLDPPTGEDEGLNRRLLDALIRMFGGPGLPVSQSEIEDAAQAMLRAMELRDFIKGTPFEKLLGPTLDVYTQTFQSLVLQKWGPQAAGSAFAMFSELIRPPVPKVEEIPTAEEFLSEFNTAYTAQIEAMRNAGDLTGEEAEYAYNVIRPGLFRDYTAKLAYFAQLGMSPFQLKEVSREERGVAPGTAAGQALEAGLGPGVTEPTRISGEFAGTQEGVARGVTGLREQVQDIGQGIPREFIALPRLMPADFLSSLGLTASDVRLRFAGDVRGAGAKRRPQGGFVSAPRRI